MVMKLFEIMMDACYLTWNDCWIYRYLNGENFGYIEISKFTEVFSGLCCATSIRWRIKKTLIINNEKKKVGKYENDENCENWKSRLELSKLWDLRSILDIPLKIGRKRSWMGRLIEIRFNRCGLFLCSRDLGDEAKPRLRRPKPI